MNAGIALVTGFIIGYAVSAIIALVIIVGHQTVQKHRWRKVRRGWLKGSAVIARPRRSQAVKP